jgi:hypothetical protein
MPSLLPEFVHVLSSSSNALATTTTNSSPTTGDRSVPQIRFLTPVRLYLWTGNPEQWS